MKLPITLRPTTPQIQLIMSDANARLGFLWKASHMLLSQCPGASSHYMSQFLSLANNRDLRLHEDIQTKSCAACGSIFVPGVNSKVRLIPVKETKLEREKRKKAARKKAKMAHSKDQDSQASQPDATSNSDNKSATLSSLATESKQQTDRQSKPPKKILHITPYSELAQQQQQRRQFGGNADGKPRKKIDKRANQILNHIIYSCQRCDRETELPGTKEGYLAARVKVNKPVSQRRKIKKEHRTEIDDQAPTSSPSFAAASTATSTSTSTSAASASGSTIPTSKSTSSKADAATFSATTNPKRPTSPLSSPAISNSKRPKYAASMPASPVGGLSMASSVASSAATSPASSQRLPGQDSGKSANSNKKKKKTGLASLLASQKAKDTSSDPNGGAAVSDGDSVLANFLMGL
ncbi:hypothetical protein EDD21DRAFT_360610, partial [Dissophora ornata]